MRGISALRILPKSPGFAGQLRAEGSACLEATCRSRIREKGGGSVGIRAGTPRAVAKTMLLTSEPRFLSKCPVLFSLSKGNSPAQPRSHRRERQRSGALPGEARGRADSTSAAACRGQHWKVRRSRTSALSRRNLESLPILVWLVTNRKQAKGYLGFLPILANQESLDQGDYYGWGSRRSAASVSRLPKRREGLTRQLE